MVVERRMQTSDAANLAMPDRKARRRRAASDARGRPPGGSGAESDCTVRRIENDERNAVFFDGQALCFILRDATLGKLFITLCSMSSLIVGSGISPYQKRDLTRLLRGFMNRGNLGYVMSIISSNNDRYMLKEADVTLGLRQEEKSVDLFANCDIQMDHIYGVTYLLFKHGTIAHRRVDTVLKEFLWRTSFTFMNQTFFFITSGFSVTLPYGVIFYAIFMSFISPCQYLLEGIFATDYGYGVLHRIFGEYK